jgi:hypothetical protein
VSDFDIIAQGMAKERANASIYAAPTIKPDEAAQAAKLGRAFGIPPSIAQADIPNLQQRQERERAQSLIERYPAIGKWASDPSHAAIAQGDWARLGKNAETWTWGGEALSILKRGLGQATSGLYGAIQGTREVAAEYDPLALIQRRMFGASIDDAIASWASSQQKAGKAIVDANQSKVQNFYGRNLIQGVDSTVTTLTGLVVGAMTKSPNAALAVMGSVTGGSEYAKAREAGKSVTQSAIYGLSQGSIEAATEKIPASRLLGDLAAKTPFAKAFFRQLTSEIPGEQVATFFQDLNEWAVLHPEKTVKDFIDARPQAFAETLLQTISGSTVQTSVAKAAEVAVNTIDRVRRPAAEAARATREQAFLDKVMAAAAESNVRKIAPDAFQAFIEKHSEGTGAENIFIPAEKLATYFQEMDFDYRADDFWGGYADQIDEGSATGGDVVISTAAAAAHLSGTPTWEAVKADTRLSPGGQSPSEAQAFNEGVDDYLDTLSGQMADQLKANDEARGPIQKIVDDIRTKLTNAGYRFSEATANAEVVAQRVATRMARLGRPVTGDETAKLSIEQVLPAGLAPYVAADPGQALSTRLKPVIAAMRKKRGPRSEAAQKGPSLLDFIAKSGGMNDVGGELRSRDIGPVKGVAKKGSRKLINAEGLGPDEILRNAVEAGYFPELEGIFNNDANAAQAVDTQPLYDAIDAELFGNARYSGANDTTSESDAIALAASDLARILDEAGISPETATDRQIEKAIEDYRQASQDGLQKTGSATQENISYDQSVRSGRIRRTIDELVAAAESQKNWRTWYQRHEQTIVDMFGEDADLFQKLLSATSQATGVKGNVTLALKAYDQLFSGEEFTGYLPAVIKNLERIRADENLAGAKISQYGKANEGDTSAIAVDRHIAMLFFNTKTPNPKQIASAKKRITEIAKRLEWEPRQVQAALWAFNQVRLGTDPDKVESYDKILESRIAVVSALRAKLGRGKDGSLSTSGDSLEGNIEGQESSEQELAPRRLLQSDAFQNYGDDSLSDVVEVDDLISDEMVPSLTAQDLVGLSIFPTISDRTAAAATYGGIDSAGAERKIALLGGPLFPLRLTNWLANVVWANRGKGVTAQKADKLVKGATHMMVVMGDADMHISNTTVQNAFLSTIEAYIRAGRISSENLSKLADIIRAPSKITIDSKTGLPKEKGKKTLAVESRLADFPGFNDVRAFEKYVHSLSFEARKRVLAKMSSKEAQKLGAPSMTRILDATREPSMSGHRWGDGVLLVELDKERPFITLGEEGTMPHPDFPLGIRGKVVGRMKTPLNYETLWSEWTDDAKAKGKKNVRRAFELAKPVIKVTQELADRIAASEASGIDSARQARLAVDFVLGNWKTTDAGVKQGGISPQEYLDAIDNSPAKSVLSDYTLKQVKKDVKTGAMTVYQLGADGQIFFALKRGDPSYAADYGIETPGITDNEVMLTSVINNEQGARGVGGPSVVLKALQEGATVLDCFAVKNDKYMDGFLPKLYAEFGFEKVAEVPFDPSYYDKTKLAEAIRYWKESTPGYDPETHGYPPLVIMKWTGTDEQRADIVQRYLDRGLEDLLSRGTRADVTSSFEELAGDDRQASGRLSESDAGAAGGMQGNARPGLSDRLRRLVGAVGSLTPEGARNLGLTPEEVARVGETQSRTFDQSVDQPDGSRTLNQTLNDGPRGQISFSGGWSFIKLFESRNASTFIHEMGHDWLEELKADAEANPDNEQLTADWQAVQDWFKANGSAVKDGVIPTNAHELWARGIERFMMEGKSPSMALRRIMETFKAWLTQIYKTADALRSPITPEIREVMQRLLATDEEIAQARQAQSIEAGFTDAAQAGMSEAEFAAYKAAASEARDTATDTLLKRVMSAIRRERTKEWNDEAETVRADVSETVNARPEFRALNILRTGTVDGSPGPSTKLDRAWLVSTYGEGVLGELPKQVPPIHAETNTIEADELAEIAGFKTGDEMVRALIAVEARRREMKANGDNRSVRVAMIEDEVKAVMRERYGDVLTDGSIEEEALAAVHNERQGELMAAELRQLARQTNKTPTPYRIAREWARSKIASSKVVDATSGTAIQQYARAAARAGKAFQEAIMKGDRNEAFKQKQAQMLNNALVAEAGKAKEAVEKAVERMRKIAKRRTMKTVDQAYLERAQALLDQVEFNTRSQRSINRQESFEAWANERAAEGHEIVVPPSFEASLGTVNWSRLPVEKLLALDAAVSQIIHLGRFKQQLIDNKEARDFDAVVTEAEDAASKLPPVPPKSTFVDPSFLDRIKSGVSSWDVALLKIETLVDWLDGGNPNGVFNRIVFAPIAAAQARAADMRKAIHVKLNDALKAIPKEQLRKWSERVTTPELIDRETGEPAVFVRQKLISMALNMGNEGNAQRLSDGYKWTEADILDVLNRELTADEWTYVQSVWDIIDELWPEASAMERRVNGVAPDKVEARAIATSAGTLRGGYFPAIYDSTRDYQAEQNAERESDLFSAMYTKANTRASSTKDRAQKVSRPILLDLGVIGRHVDEVIHDITHREVIMNADKFLSSKRVMRAIDTALGQDARKQFRPWLKFVANQWASERAGNEGIAQFLSKLRTNTTIVGMGFRFTTVMMQIAGYSNSFEVVGAKWVTQGIAATAKHPIETFNFVMERSDEVRNRMDTLDRDIANGIAKLTGKDNPLTKAQRFAFHGIGLMDRVVVIPTWIGAYNKALSEGMDETQAAYAGDKAVRQSQGSGAAKDMAAVVRGTGKGGEALKLMTMFYSYMSAVYQRQRTFGRDVLGATPRDVPALMARAWWLFVVPPILSELLVGRGPEDDEDWGMWAFKKILFQSLGAIPIVRDVAQPVWDNLVGNRAFDYQMSPVQRGIQSVVEVAKDARNIATGEPTKRATQNVLTATGYATGLVPGQLAQATQFLVDVGHGDANPKDASDWFEGLTTGKLKDD